MNPEDVEKLFWDDAPTRQLSRGKSPTRPTRRIHSTRPSGAARRPPTTSVDPLLRRLGVLVAVIVLAIPVALALRSGSAEGETLRPGTATLTTETIAPATDPATTPVTTPVATVAATVTEPPTVATPAATAPPTTQRKAVVAPTTAPLVCRGTYVVVKGDSWSRIASKVGVSTKEMLTANRATAHTLLLPGQTVCLPDGATPTTIPSPTTAPRVTTTTVKKAPATTTAAPATTAPAGPRPTYTREQVIQLIRDVWPDNLEQHAIDIANRESRFNPNAANSCCYGVFQINYNAHKRWLPTIGVTSAAQLFDPRVNVYAAYVIYQRAGGFGPWGG